MVNTGEPTAARRSVTNGETSSDQGVELGGMHSPAAPPSSPLSSGDTRRRRGEKRQAGFGDDLDRAFCTAYQHEPPRGFPVQHRTGVATRRSLVVARRPTALLLCDGAHTGFHYWPNGEKAGDEGAGDDVDG